MKSCVRYFVLIIFILTGVSGSSVAQILYKQTGNSNIAISGTSTLHDWTMTSKEVRCQATFEIDTEGIPTKLSALSLSVRSESLKSEHKAMDKNAYSTLSTDEHPSITFDLTSATIAQTKIQCVGNLTIAGVTKEISFDAVYKTMPNYGLLCTGTKKLKMSDFGVEAPSFMFGTVKTGDEITVKFSVALASAKK